MAADPRTLYTHRPPFSDVIDLISYTESTDSDGYVTKTEVRSPVFCTFSDAVSRREFYEATKAGLSLSGQAEMWPVDYDGQKVVEHDSTLFNIIRTYPTGRGTVMLILEEVIR